MTAARRTIEISRRGAAVLVVLAIQVLAASDARPPGPPADIAAPQQIATAAGDAAEAEIRRLLTDAQYADAETRARALVAAREAEAPASLALANALDLLVQALVEGGKPQDPDALASATRAVAIKERATGATDPALAVSLANLGLVLRRQGKVADARAAYERALSIREAALGREHADVARTLAALSALSAAAGDFAQARELGERAVHIAERLTPPDRLLEAGAANNLAQALFEASDYAGAKQRLEQALGAYEEALGPDHPEVGKTLSNLATVVSETGDLSGARGLYERATSIQEKRQGPDHPDVALNINNLADIFFLVGDYTQSARLFERALRSLERALGPQHTRVAMVLGNLAQVRVAEGDLSAARPLYARALQIRETALGRDHPSLVYTLTGFAELHVRLREYDEARDKYERALAIAERAYGADSAMTALVLQGLGDLLLARGDLAGAEDGIGRALRIRSELLGDDHPLVAESRAALALIMARQRRVREAMDAALEAERVARAHLQITAQALDERQALAYAERRVSGGDIILSLLASAAGSNTPTAERAWDAVVRSRALILEEMASRRRVVSDVDDPAVVQLAGALAAARQRLAGLLVRSAADPASRQRVEQAARERDAAERALAEHSLAFGAERARMRIGITDALRALPTQAALIAFVRFRRSGVEAAGAPLVEATHAAQTDNAETRDEYLAFVARADGTPVVAVPLGKADVIDRAVTRWRANVVQETEAGMTGARSERVHRQLGTILRRLIWDPIGGNIGAETQLFIVPAGPLHLVNWSALPVGTRRYLVENAPVIHYLSSERDLVRQEGAMGEGLLVVDDPAYDTTAQSGAGGRERRGPSSRRGAVPNPCGDLSELRFDRLPESRREGDEIAAIWSSLRGTAASQQATPGVVRLSGARATESAVRRSLVGKRVIHLATHGFFLGSWCGQRAPDADAGTDRPLLVAGLALTGANARARRPPADDGVLLAEEIATLDLRGVEWAVLSACDTGTGVLRAGDELFGLRRVFQVAGVNTVIVSLWPVDDEMTRRWMTEVYKLRFAEGKPTAAALRAATVQAIASRRSRGQSTHPAYWGSFIATGQW